MFLKKASIVTAVAAAALATTVSAVSAASDPATKAIEVVSTAYTINGVSANIHTFVANGKTQASLWELSGKLGASVDARSDGYTVTLNGNSLDLKLNENVTKVAGKPYVELVSFVQTLGALIESDATGATWIDAQLLGSVDRVQWLDGNRLIASQDTEEGRVDYLVNAKLGSYVKLSLAAGASDLVVAPNGHVAAYTNDAGEIYLIELNSRLTFKVSADTNIKPELVWSSDSKTIYFLQGDKATVVAKLDLELEKISTVFDDKVEYKANLGVSTDGKTFTYTVTKPGAVVADANKPVENDDVTIDTKNTEPQVFAYTVDPSVKDNKAVQLTSTATNKVFFAPAADGSSVTFVNVGADDAAVSTLVSVAKDKTVKTVFDKADIYEATQSGGNLILLTAGEGDKQAIYEVDAAGNSKLLYTVSADVTDVIAKNGALAIVDNGRVFVNVDGHWKPTTN
ncbi:hypothetical protein [Cohnella sp. GCM10027633]|uniref:hypothetical protein n=1 Tax=unclassified Cohnella TaxID=2636738 RepID=UPI0036378C53